MRASLLSRRWSTTVGSEASSRGQLCSCDLEPVDQYLRTFNWNKVKYRADRPLSNLIDILQKVRSLDLLGLYLIVRGSNGHSQEVTSIDNDVKSKYNQYNQVKTNLTSLQKRQTYASFPSCHRDRLIAF